MTASVAILRLRLETTPPEGVDAYAVAHSRVSVATVHNLSVLQDIGHSLFQPTTLHPLQE
jgi:hypothetical protein